MYSEGQWVFNNQYNYGNEDERIFGLYIPSEPRKRFENFQGVKVFPGDKMFLVSENKYFEKQNKEDH
jgi:hypothetical protein